MSADDRIRAALSGLKIPGPTATYSELQAFAALVDTTRREARRPPRAQPATITRTADTETIAGRLYRFSLTRQWGDGPRVLFVMLNPSLANADGDDPTIRRCIGFTRQWGRAGLEVVNLFAVVSPEPSILRSCPDPVGPRNDAAIIGAAQRVHFMLARLKRISIGVAIRLFPMIVLCGSYAASNREVFIEASYSLNGT